MKRPKGLTGRDQMVGGSDRPSSDEDDDIQTLPPGYRLQPSRSGFFSIDLPVRLTKEALLGKTREAYNGVHEHCNASCAPRRTGGRSPRFVGLLAALAGGRAAR